jgi:hypothetical protein
MRSRCCLCVCVCVCVSVYPPYRCWQRLGKNTLIVARQRLGRNVTAVTNTHRQQQKNCWTRRIQCGSWRIKERRRLVLPRTSCFLLHSLKIHPWAHEASHPMDTKRPFYGGKASGAQNWPLAFTSGEATNTWSYTYSPIYCHVVQCLIKHMGSFTFIRYDAAEDDGR